MHYGVIAIVRPEGQMNREHLSKLVDVVLEPYGEGREWDWFQIGGRWTGHFDDYDPSTDATNVEVCDICGGTGDRATHRGEPREQQHETGCNGCLGKGTRTKWPTQWAPYAGDIKPVEALTEKDYEVFALAVDGYWHGGEDYIPWAEDGGKFQKRPMPPLEWVKKTYVDCLAVIVDCHN